MLTWVLMAGPAVGILAVTLAGAAALWVTFRDG